MQGDLGTAVLLTTGAGLATTVGSVLGLIVKRPGKKLLGLILGFSAGVMILVSFVSLLRTGIESLEAASGHYGFLYAHAAFVGGILARNTRRKANSNARGC